MEPIIPIVDRTLIKQELEGHLLRPSNKAGNLVYDITAHTAPNVMREIARLREISYRHAGGATGQAMDIDDMDTMPCPYHQLLVWDPENEQIVSGYRYLLCRQATFSPDGQPYITSAHLFHYSDRFIRDYLPYTIEFGRAFVQPQYQTREAGGTRALFALDNIWDGIGAVLYNHPEVRYMIGKVTIYPDFDPRARDLIYAYLARYHSDREGLCAPYHPVAISPEAQAQADTLFAGNDVVADYHALQHAVRAQGTVLPPMFSAYLNLTETLRFFGNARNDQLADVYETGIMLDIADVHPDKLLRYLGGYADYLHDLPNNP